MVWIVGLVAVIGFAWLMYTNDQFRRFGFGVLAVSAAAVALIWFHLDKDGRERQRALTAISPSQLALTDLVLVPSNYGGTNVGRVTNDGTETLRSFTLRVYLQECAQSREDEHCVTVGQDDAIFIVNVPPSQARRLSSSVNFDDMPPLGPHWRWNFEITEIEADLRP